MCTVSIKVNDNLLHKAWANMDKDVDMAEWMQQQIEAILLKMALDSEREAQPTSHSWDDYEVSPEILDMAPKERLNVYGQVTLQRLMDFAAADPKTITLNDLAGILPAPQTLIEELRDEYIREKYGV